MYTITDTSVYDNNLGMIDRILRVLASIAMIGAFMGFQSADGSIVYSLLALIAVPVAATALMSWDPLYALLGINSRGERSNPRVTEANIGRADSYVRYAISAALVFGFMLLAPTPVGWTVLLPLLALPVFNTALTGWCPVYTLLALSSRPLEQAVEAEGVVYPGFPKVPRPEEIRHGKKAA